VLYAALNELVFSPKEYKCYAHTLEKIKDDPRVTVRIGEREEGGGTARVAARTRTPAGVFYVAAQHEPPPAASTPAPAPATPPAGSPVSAYGTESRNRAARQRIPHRVFNDAEGREHVQLQFHMRGPSGRAVVNADMYQEGGQWRYNFLYLNVESPVPQQVVLVRPGQGDYF
jgi:import inner membrane translocase subunit TIM21